MKAFFAICCIAFSFHAAIGQQLLRYKGSLILRNNNVLKGQIAVQPSNNEIVFMSGDLLTVYTADKIQSVYFYDCDNNVNRRFVSLRKKIDAITADYLYEVVVSGEVKILRRLIFPVADSGGYKNGYHYFVHANNELIAISKFNSKVFPELLRNSETLFRFVDARKLNPNKRADIIKIVEYYNAESSMKSLLASR